MNGKNIMDFVDPDIAEKLDALEREEQKLENEGNYDSVEEMVRAHIIQPISCSLCDCEHYLV